MKSITRFKPLVLVALTAIFTTGFVEAAEVTWDGGSTVPTANWTDGGNWVGDVAPNPTDSLVFDGAVQVANTNDFAADTNFAGITIAATAASMTLSGNSINLSGDIAMNRPTTSTINTSFVLQQNVAIDVPQGAAVLTLGGLISGGFKVTKTGAGFATYNVPMTYSGGTEISAGALRTGSDAITNTTLGSGAITLINGAALELRGTGGATFNNDLVLGSGGGTIAFRGSDFFQPATLTGSGPLTVTGIANTTVTPLDFKGWNGQVNGVIAAGNTLTIRLDNAYVNNSLLNASVDLGAGVSLTKRNGTNGTMTIDVGKLSGAVGSVLGPSAAGGGVFNYSIGARNEDSTFDGTIVDGGTQTGIVKVGSGTLTLTNTNTYAGVTTVNGGRLLVNGSHTTDAADTFPVGDYVVNNGGTLGGIGTIGDGVDPVLVTVNSGGTLSPGASTGTLSVLGDVTLNSGSIFKAEVDDVALTTDLLAVTGNLSLGGASLMPSLLAGTLPAEPYIIASYTGTLTGDFSVPSGTVIDYGTRTNSLITMTINTLPPLRPGDFDNDGDVDAADYVKWRDNDAANSSLPNDNNLTTQQDRYNLWRSNFGNQYPPASSAGIGSALVPEPATCAMMMMLLLTGCAWRRRK